MKEAFEKIRKRIIKLYGECPPIAIINPRIEDVKESNAYLKCLEIVREVEAEYINKSTEHINKSGDCSNNWIDVKDRLPENDDDVLVWYRYRMMQGVNIVGSKELHGIGHYYEPTESWLIYGGFGLDQNVIAWMPLPEPYKPEKGV